jgi:hypothetical protein
MHDALQVRVVEGFRDLHDGLRGQARDHAPVAKEERLQRLPLHQLHGEVGHAFHLAPLEDAHDVGMMQGAADLRLAQEALQELRLFQEGGQGTLERVDLAAPLHPVDRRHAPASERLDQPIVAEVFETVRAAMDSRAAEAGRSGTRRRGRGVVERVAAPGRRAEGAAARE